MYFINGSINSKMKLVVLLLSLLCNLTHGLKEVSPLTVKTMHSESQDFIDTTTTSNEEDFDSQNRPRRKANPTFYLRNMPHLRPQINYENSFASYDYAEPEEDFIYRDDKDIKSYSTNSDHLKEKYPNIKSIILLEQDENKPILDWKESKSLYSNNRFQNDRPPRVKIPFQMIDLKEMNFLERLYRYVNKISPDGDFLTSTSQYAPPTSSTASFIPYLSPNQRNLNHNHNEYPNLKSHRNGNLMKQMPNFQHPRSKFKVASDQNPSQSHVIRINEKDGFENLNNVINRFMSTLEMRENNPVEVVVEMKKEENDAIPAGSTSRSFNNPDIGGQLDSNVSEHLTTSLKKLMLNQIYLLSESLETLKELEKNIGITNDKNEVNIDEKEIKKEKNISEIKTEETKIRTRRSRDTNNKLLNGLKILNKALESENYKTSLLLLENLILDANLMLRKLASQNNIDLVVEEPFSFSYEPTENEKLKVARLKLLLKAIHSNNRKLPLSQDIQRELKTFLKSVQKLNLSAWRKLLKVTRKKRSLNIAEHHYSDDTEDRDETFSTQIPSPLQQLNLGTLVTKPPSGRLFSYPKINLVKSFQGEDINTFEYNLPNDQNSKISSITLSESTLQNRMINLNKDYPIRSPSRETWINLINKSSNHSQFTRRMLEIINNEIENSKTTQDSKEISAPLNILYEDQNILISEIPEKIIQSSTIEDLKSLIKNNGTFTSEIFIVKDGGCSILKTAPEGFVEEDCQFKDNELHLINNQFYIDPQAKVKNFNSQNAKKSSDNLELRANETNNKRKLENSWSSANPQAMKEIMSNPLYHRPKDAQQNQNFPLPFIEIISTTAPVTSNKAFRDQFSPLSIGSNLTDQSTASSDLSKLLSNNDLTNLLHKLQQQETHDPDHHHHHHPTKEEENQEHELASSLLAGLDILSNVENLIGKLEHQQGHPYNLLSSKTTIDGKELKNASSILNLLSGIQFDTEKQINIELTLDNKKSGAPSEVEINSTSPIIKKGTQNNKKKSSPFRQFRKKAFATLEENQNNEKKKAPNVLPETFSKENLVLIPANFLNNFLNVDFSEYGSKLSYNLTGSNVTSPLQDLQRNLVVPKKQAIPTDSDINKKLLKHRKTLLDIIADVEKSNKTIAEALLKNKSVHNEESLLKLEEQEESGIREKKEISELIKSDKFIDSVISTFFQPLIASALNKSDSNSTNIIKQINITKSQNTTAEGGDNLEIFILRYDGKNGFQTIFEDYQNSTKSITARQPQGRQTIADSNDTETGTDLAINPKNGTNIRVTISINSDTSDNKKPSSPFDIIYKDILSKENQTSRDATGGYPYRPSPQQYSNSGGPFHFDNYRRNSGFSRLGLPSKLVKTNRRLSSKNQDFSSSLRNQKFSSRMQKLNINDQSIPQMMPPMPLAKLIPHYQFPVLLPLETGVQKSLVQHQRDNKPKWLWMGNDASRPNTKRKPASIALGQHQLRSLARELNDFFDQSGLDNQRVLKDEKEKWKW